MNSSDDPISPRWLKDPGSKAVALPTTAEETVLAEVLRALRTVRHGSVQLAIQDGRVMQIDITEKRRL